jgi:ACR3 family arsenite transporter
MQTRLNTTDRYLTLWIFMAMAAGLLLGSLAPDQVAAFQSISVGTTHIPLAVGLIVMMYPPLVRVDYHRMRDILAKPKLIGPGLLITWVLGPLLMFGLGTLFLRDHPEYLSGLLIIGLAPCIAMVIVWNELAGGNRELCAGLVGINSLLQVFFFSAYAWFYLHVMLPLTGAEAIDLQVSMGDIAQTVGVYLGIPFLAAIISRMLILRIKGEDWLQRRFIPKVAPLTLYALLFTIVVMFSLKAESLLRIPFDVLRVALPLSIFFVLMFFFSFWVMKKLGADYRDSATMAFTASGNNFELAIAVSIGVFGIDSPQAFTGVIGPLVEVPVLITLVRAAFFLKQKWFTK